MAATAYALLFDLDSPYMRLNLIFLLIFYVLTEFGIEGGFHRLLAHRAFQSLTALKAFLIVLGSMAVQGPVLLWVATHRHHHACSDLEDDPHSPIHGLLHAHMGWHFSRGFSSVVRYAPDLLVDPLILRLNNWYWAWVALGLLAPAALMGLVTNSVDGCCSGLLWGGLVRVCLTQHATWSVNSICHRFGSRPFDTPGLSRNNFWLAIPTLGQSWHNNHHAYPNKASMSFKWWQVDLCGSILRMLKTARLVTYL